MSSGDIRHVVLVVFDTLRRDAVGSYGTPAPWMGGDASDPNALPHRIATPHLDAFARESVRFTRAYPEALPTLCARRRAARSGASRSRRARATAFRDRRCQAR